MTLGQSRHGRATRPRLTPRPFPHSRRAGPILSTAPGYVGLRPRQRPGPSGQDGQRVAICPVDYPRLVTRRRSWSPVAGRGNTINP